MQDQNRRKIHCPYCSRDEVILCGHGFTEKYMCINCGQIFERRPDPLQRNEAKTEQEQGQMSDRNDVDRQEVC